MVVINTPLSVWTQISSLSFSLAGNYSDLLIIRICLSSAYIFLFTNSILGAPIWPHFRKEGHLQIDGILWSILNLYVHLSTVIRLFLDERPVKLKEQNEALWRVFYRTGGLSKKLFQQTIDPYCNVVTYHQNDDIPMDDQNQNRKWFYIIYEGQVELKVVAFRDEYHTNKDSDGGGVKQKSKKILSSTTRIAESGQLFDFKSVGFLREAHSPNTLEEPYSYQQEHLQSLHDQKHKLQSAKAVSEKVVLFRFPAPLMATRIANHPTTRLMWKELLMENLLRIVQRHFYKTRRERIESNKHYYHHNVARTIHHRNSDLSTNHRSSNDAGGVSDDNREVEETTTDNNGYDNHPPLNNIHKSKVKNNTASTQPMINPMFWPLEPWEEPDPVRAGSGLAIHRPFLHIIKSMQASFTPPWPFKGFPTGLRHQQYLRPPDQKQKQEVGGGEKSPPVMSGQEGNRSRGDAHNGKDPESQSLLAPSTPAGDDISGGYNSVESFRSSLKQEEGDFLEYLNEMDETTGLGLNISFLASSSQPPSFTEDGKS